MIRLNFKKLIPITLSLIILIGVIAVSSGNNTSAPTVKTQSNKNISSDKTENSDVQIQSEVSEMRGIWVSYMELSMENDSDKSENSFRNKFEKIAENCRGFGMNTLIVQVRPFGDALYKSEYYPMSHILTGTQGKNPGYDPLKIMCEICKSKSLKIHAWINPYRVSTNKTPPKLSDNNPYIKDKSLGIETESGIYLDPSNENARKLIISGVEEIINNYDLDGIQFDDYFYPTDIENKDKTQYDSYLESVGNGNSMNIDNWRKANVNMLICDVYRKVHSLKNDVVFGISPQGNINNNDEIYADVKSWCTCRGFVDYICPQIYFSLENPRLTFENSLESWSELEFADNVKLYVGLAGYKAGTDDDEGTWLDSDNILADEYEILNNNEKSSGFMLYSYASLIDNISRKEMQNLKNKLH